MYHDFTDMEELVEQKVALKDEFTKHQQSFAQQKAAIKQAEVECRQKQQMKPTHCVTTRCLRYVVGNTNSTIGLGNTMIILGFYHFLTI